MNDSLGFSWCRTVHATQPKNDDGELAEMGTRLHHLSVIGLPTWSLFIELLGIQRLHPTKFSTKNNLKSYPYIKKIWNLIPISIQYKQKRKSKSTIFLP